MEEKITGKRNWDAYKNRCEYCGGTFLLLQLKPTCDASQIVSNPQFRIVSNRCKTKICKVCGGINIRQIRKRIKDSFLQEKLRMFTFDIQPTGNVEENLHFIEDSWRLLYKRLKLQYPYLRYFKVMEIGKQNNMVHIHGIWNIYIKWEDLRDIWIEVSGSQSVWLTKTDSFKGSIDYCLKYVRKAFNDPRTVKWFYEGYKRVFSCSSKGVLEKRKKAIYELYDLCQREKNKMVAFIGYLLCQTNNYDISSFECKEIENFHSLVKLEETNCHIREGPSPFKNLSKVKELEKELVKDNQLNLMLDDIFSMN